MKWSYRKLPDAFVMRYIERLIYVMPTLVRKTVLPIALSLLGVPLIANAHPLNPLRLRPHHITAAVRDLDRAADWYQRVLGFSLRQRGTHGDVTFVELAIPGFGVALIKQPAVGGHPARIKDGEPRWLHMVFSVPNPDVAYHALELKGASLTARRSPNGHIQSFLVTDSEGNELEIVADSGS